MNPWSEPESRLPGISLVIPAFNEESRIGPTLAKYSNALESSGRPFEIIVVADGSDGTPEIASNYSKKGVKILTESHKLGKGGAILKGFRFTTYPVLGYVDADGSLDPLDLKRLILTAARDGCAIGSRRTAGSVWIRSSSIAHRLASRVFNILVRGVLGVPVSDTQCGAKFYTRSALGNVLDRVQVTNMTVDTAILFHLRREGKKITEVPITWVDAPGSRFTLGSEVLVMLLTLLGIRIMNLGRTKRKLRGRMAALLNQKYEAV